MPSGLDALKTSIGFILTNLEIRLKKLPQNLIAPDTDDFFNELINHAEKLTQEFLVNNEGNDCAWVYPALYAFLQIKYHTLDKIENSQILFIPDELIKLHTNLCMFFQKNFTTLITAADQGYISHAERCFYALIAVIMVILMKDPDSSRVVMDSKTEDDDSKKEDAPTFLDIIGVSHDARMPTKPEQMSFVDFLILSIEYRDIEHTKACFKLAYELIHEMKKRHNSTIGRVPPPLVDNLSTEQRQLKIDQYLGSLFGMPKKGALYNIVNEFSKKIEMPTMSQPKNSYVLPSVRDLQELKSFSERLLQHEEYVYSIGGALQLFDIHKGRINHLIVPNLLDPELEWDEWLDRHFVEDECRLTMSDLFIGCLQTVFDNHPNIQKMSYNPNLYIVHGSYSNNTQERVKLIFTMDGRNKPYERVHWSNFLSTISEIYKMNLYCPISSPFKGNYTSRYFTVSERNNP